MKYDTNDIRANNSLVDVIGGYIELKQNGPELEACCPFHDEKTPSFSVVPNKGFYHCFGCGAHGDQIDFVMEYERVDFKEACKILGGERQKGEGRPELRIVETVDPYAGITTIIPVPDTAPRLTVNKKTPQLFNPKRADDPEKRETTYTPSMVFPYLDAEGQLLGYCLRVDFGDNAKITPILTWCKLPDGREMWTHGSWDKPRPLYGLDRLSGSPDKPVMICEGEKAADAAHRLLGDAYTCISWPGGTHGRHHVNWSPLKGRRILAWPDMDQPGIDAMIGHESNSGWKKGIAEYTAEAGAIEFKYIDWDKSKEKGWDAADAEVEKLTKADVVKWAKSHVKIWAKEKPVPDLCEEREPAGEEQLAMMSSYDDNYIPDDQQYIPSEHQEEADVEPFRILGFNRDYFYYLPDRSQQIKSLTAAQHTKNNLISLAPLNYWETEFPIKTGFDIDAATNALVNKAYQTGLFDAHELLRGRGAWLDDGRAVLHLGGRCYVDGIETRPRDVKSKYIYENQSNIDIKPTIPLINKEANKLAEICNSLSWDNDLSGAILAGWCVIAPVSGILTWRPHIWITGQSGSGKSTIVNNIIGSILGNMRLKVEGKTTEAGIRQQLCQDARPIVFDEAEAEDDASAKRMQGIIDLARVSSSGGQIVKGSQNGGGVSFSMRSCFCFASINTSVQHFADESRITKLILKRDDDINAKEKYDKLDRFIVETLNREYSSALLARSIKYLPTLQKNCVTFIDAAASVFKSRRIADQLGTMLAGYFLCYSTKEITLDEAIDWLVDRDWSEHTTLNTSGDEQRLLEYIATRRYRMEDDKGFHDVSIGELILTAAFRLDKINPDDAQAELRRHGIMIENDHVLISNTAAPMREMLRGTPWASNWSRPLKDIYKADAAGSRYFAPGINSKAVKLPISLFEE